ncbi:AzlD family protein [Paraburkholderia sp. J7]|uniref:AzlD family protein n=1 Tax=Paraburkholderia sp. J7 TaxID=2805438 RepID=UPI002AB714AD|nr:AzlD family protein [Paraburkholderia sp. J7]
MIPIASVLTIALMAVVTYLTRALGYIVLRNRNLSPRATRVLEAAPGCVLISVIAPDFVSRHPADLIALAVTLFAATRLSTLPTVVVGVVTAALFRHLLG